MMEQKKPLKLNFSVCIGSELLYLEESFDSMDKLKLVVDTNSVFDPKNKDLLESDYSCLICSGVLMDPASCPQCKQMFCRGCVF